MNPPIKVLKIIYNTKVCYSEIWSHPTWPGNHSELYTILLPQCPQYEYFTGMSLHPLMDFLNINSTIPLLRTLSFTGLG